MKHIKFFAVLMAAFMLFGTAAQAQDDDMSEVLNELNKDCPMDMGEGMTLSHFGYDGANLVLNIKYEDDAAGETLQALKEYPDLMRESMLLTMVEDPDMAALIEGLKDAGMGISIVIKGTRSRKSVEYTFSVNELEKAMKNKGKPSVDDVTVDGNDELDAMLLIASAACPIQMNEAMSITAIVHEGDIVIMEMTIFDGDTYDGMCAIGEATVRQAVEDVSFADMLMICKQYNVGFGLRFRKAGTLESCLFTLPYSEL